MDTNKPKTYLWFAYGYEDAINHKSFDETKQFQKKDVLTQDEMDAYRFYRLGFNQAIKDTIQDSQETV